MPVIKKTLKELMEMFPFLSHEFLKWEKEHPSLKTEVGVLNRLAKMNEKKMALAMLPDIVEMTIKIDWKNSRTWGYNPHASYYCLNSNKTWGQGNGFTCSGCGYDKESTVVAKIFNEIMVGMVYRKLKRNRKNAPYGVNVPDKGGVPSFSGGVGINCYIQIVAWLGGKMEHVAWSDTFDQYKITFKKNKK